MFKVTVFEKESGQIHEVLTVSGQEANAIARGYANDWFYGVEVVSVAQAKIKPTRKENYHGM